jgi:hypothetical protein
MFQWLWILCCLRKHELHSTLGQMRGLGQNGGLKIERLRDSAEQEACQENQGELRVM